MMMMTMVRNAALTMGLLAATAATASASSVYGTDVTGSNLIGSRTGSGKIVDSGSYVGTTLSWTIDFNNTTPGLWHYSYTLKVGTSTNPGKNISHMLLEVSDDVDSIDEFKNFSSGVSLEGPDDFGDEGNSSPGFPSGVTIWSIKITPVADSPTLTFSFDTSRAPVWGNFYTKGGQDYAYNAALGIAGFNSDDINKFIARPDGAGGVVPEPTSIVMLGLGAAGLTGVAARRRKARTA